MKIWEVIKEGKHGEVYEASVNVDAWDGAQIQVTDRDGYKAVIYFKTPNIHNKHISTGKSITLVGAVCEAEWTLVGVFDEAAQLDLPSL